MRRVWFQEENRFSVLTDLLEKSVGGGTILRSNLDPEEVELYEEGVEEGFVTKLEHVVCGGCDKTYAPEDVPDRCICGYDFPDEVEPNNIEYVTYKYPDIISEFLGDSIDGFEIVYERFDLDRVTMDELHFQDLGEQYLHISPKYKIDSGIHIYPGYNDVFLSWNRVPSLIDSPEDVMEDIEDFLKSLNDGRELVSEEGITQLPSGPGGTVSAYSDRTDWFTLLHDISKGVANSRSKAAFGMNYNDLFERLGIDFLHTMFPHAMTFHAGGGNKPDGYVIQEKSTYLVESKCYSDEFKIFSEEDKANRYVEDFVERVDNEPDRNFNLTGYIFVAHQFNEGALPEDIRSFVRRNIDSANLDVICANDLMMREAVERLSEVYSTNPSARYRIFDYSDRYADFLELMADLTEQMGTDVDQFSDAILSQMEDIAEDPSEVENVISSGFEGKSKVDHSLISP